MRFSGSAVNGRRQIQCRLGGKRREGQSDAGSGEAKHLYALRVRLDQERTLSRIVGASAALIGKTNDGTPTWVSRHRWRSDHDQIANLDAGWNMEGNAVSTILV